MSSCAEQPKTCPPTHAGPKTTHIALLGLVFPDRAIVTTGSRPQDTGAWWLALFIKAYFARQG
jgi:hypothetical protein